MPSLLSDFQFISALLVIYAEGNSIVYLIFQCVTLYVCNIYAIIQMSLLKMLHEIVYLKHIIILQINSL